MKNGDRGTHSINIKTAVSQYERGTPQPPRRHIGRFPFKNLSAHPAEGAVQVLRASTNSDPSAEPRFVSPGFPSLAPTRPLRGSRFALPRLLVRASLSLGHRPRPGLVRGAAPRRPAPDPDTHFRRSGSWDGARQGAGAWGGRRSRERWRYCCGTS